MAHDTQTETWDKRSGKGVGAPKGRPKKGFKKKKYTKEQLAMHKSIKEKRHGGKKFKGKVFDASPIQLAKAGMTESKMYGLPGHSKTFKNSKLTQVKPYGGTIDTGFTGWDKKNKGKGFKSGGRAALQGGGRTRLLEELGRVEAEPSNRNRRAEISRVHGELNRGYKSGGAVLKGKKVGIQIK